MFLFIAILRKITFIAAAFCLASWPALQLIVISTMTVIMACNILHFKPFGPTVDSWLSVSNEAALIIVVYFMMSFSEWISD